MLKIFFAVGTVLTLLLGAMGVGAAAAQNIQPGEPLYALKTWGEPLQFMLQAREQVQMQTMNGLVPVVAEQGSQNQVRAQMQEMFQAQQMNSPSGNGTGRQDQEQLRLQTRDRLQTCQTLDPSVTTSGNQVCDQTQDRDQIRDQDQIQSQTQDRLHMQDCVPDPQGSAAQNQYGGPHKP